MKRGGVLLVDETGNVHGPWRVLGRAGNDGGGRAKWRVRCERCGSERDVGGSHLRQHPPRCGCAPRRGGTPPAQRPRERGAPAPWRKDATGSVPDHLRAVLGD